MNEELRIDPGNTRSVIGFPLIGQAQYLLALSAQLFLIDRVRPDAFDHLKDFVTNVKLIVERRTNTTVFTFCDH